MTFTNKWARGLLLASLLVGCSSAPDSGAIAGADQMVVQADNLSNSVTVFDDRLEFDPHVERIFADAHVLDKLDAYASAADKTTVEPVFLIGKRQSSALDDDGAVRAGLRNPTGYLRRGVSWRKGQNGAIVVETVPADMAEAVEEMKKNGFVDVPDPASVSPRDDRNGVDTASGWGNTDKRWSLPIGPDGGFIPIDLSGRTLWQKSLLAGGNVKVALKTGRITIRPTADIHLLVQRFIPREASAAITTDIDGELQIEATADGAFDVAQEGSLFQKTWGTEVKGLPISLGVEVKYACEVAASGRSVATAGATARASFRAGVEVQGFHLTGILEPPQPELARIGPSLDTNVNVQGVCHLTSTLTLQVFDAAGPQATADIYAKLSADGTQAQLGAQAQASLVAGMDASVRGTLKPFGFKLADITVPPYHYEKELFAGQISLGQGASQ